MSAVLTTIAGVGLTAVDNLPLVSNILQIIPKGQIDSITVDATLEEVHTQQLAVTDHPVETGATISDHSFRKPVELVMTCGWSNSSFNALSSVLSGNSGITGILATGSLSVSDYVTGVYSQLDALQSRSTLFDVVTSLKTYSNMLMTSLRINRDVKTAQALMCVCTFREIILVSTQTTSLPPAENMANPSDNQGASNLGPVSALPDPSPAAGGSFPVVAPQISPAPLL